MATLEEIVVQLTAETSQLRADMKTAADVTASATDKMEKAVEEFTKNSAKNTSFFQSAFSTMVGVLGSSAVQGAIGLVKDGFHEITGVLAEGITAANAEEDAMKRLATQLALTGQFSKAGVEGLRDFAGEMEKVTGVQDDAIVKNLALLASLTKLDTEGLKKAEKAALDLSAAVGIDLDSATKLIAKGIEGNVSAFQRYGIQLQQGRNETENFANVVGKLNERFGDAAKGNLQTFSGSILALKNSFGNAFEAIARVITNNETLKTVISQLSDVFANLEKYVTANADALSQGLSDGIVATVRGMSIMVSVIGNVYDLLRLFYNSILVTVHGINDLATAVEALGNLDFRGAVDAFNDTAKSIDNVNDIISGKSTTIFKDLKDVLDDVGDAAEESAAKQTKGFETATPAIKNQKVAVDELANAFYNFRQATQDSQTAFVKGTLDSAAEFNSASKLQMDTLQAQYDAQLISFQAYSEGKLAILQQSQQNESDLLASYRASNTITETQYQIALAQQGAKAANDSLKTQTDLNKQRQENMKSTLSTIATLAESSSKELAAIGKAAAIANATIDGYAAVQKALASAPPPFNFALAAAVGVATAANVAKIAGVGLAKGIDEVPGIGTQDNFPAVLAPGERVVPSKSNEDLTNFLAENKDGGGSTKQPVVINMIFNGIGAITREQAADIVNAINDTLAASGSLRILGT